MTWVIRWEGWGHGSDPAVPVGAVSAEPGAEPPGSSSAEPDADPPGSSNTEPGDDPPGSPPAAAMPQLDDATLVVRAQEQDPRAFEELVRRHQRPLFALAVRLLGDRGAAQDAVQESFVAAWRRLDDFRGEAAFSSWMYRIVTNRCLNAARRRRPTVPLDAVVEGLATSGAESPERAAEVNERLAALHRALDGLPAQLRACWVLRNVDGLGYTEIAEVVGAGPDAVRGRIYRARIRLAEVMGPWR